MCCSTDITHIIPNGGVTFGSILIITALLWCVGEVTAAASNEVLSHQRPTLRRLSSTKKPKPTPEETPHQPFAFGSAFGDNMVLQRSPSKAAIYGFLDFAAPIPYLDGATTVGTTGEDVEVIVSIYEAGQTGSTDDPSPLHTTEAFTGINATRQPFGPDWGVRPCDKASCPPYGMQPYNPWNRPLPMWKALLPPMDAGGNYTVVAECRSVAEGKGGTTTGRDVENGGRSSTPGVATISITNVTFGDVWYCSGQSNMMLPVDHSFSRNDTVMAILKEGKYRNVRIMAGGSGTHPHGGPFYADRQGGSDDGLLQNYGGGFNPGYGDKNGSNPWKTALQAVSDGNETHPTYSLFKFGAACWYFGQRLSELGVDDVPIGLANTAIGGQRIEEYMDNSTVGKCDDRAGKDLPYWNGQLFGTQVLPFVDMTVKGWVWYQGENNMHNTKGNSAASIGYGCEMRELIEGWRRAWSEREPDTTDPLAPFGVVTLASSGSEGGPNMGAMRHAQTANYGVLPNVLLPNTFLAQAYDLDDEWGPGVGPCVSSPWSCCDGKGRWKVNSTTCNATIAKRCEPACSAAANTPVAMGGIHPRSKKAVGDRLGTAAFNSVYGGVGAYTGPTLAGCSIVAGVGAGGNETMMLEVRFDKTLLRGDRLHLNKIPPITPPRGRHSPSAGGSQLYVQIDASSFCMEPMSWTTKIDERRLAQNGQNGDEIIVEGEDEGEYLRGKPSTYCPTWAGGTGHPPGNGTHLDGGWINLNFTLSPTNKSILVDLSPLPNGAVPTAVRYAWGILDCCDYTDDDLYVSHGCLASCPIVGVPSRLPANPFQAKIVNGECSCVPPQLCSSE